jgi:hypothetical protein
VNVVEELATDSGEEARLIALVMSSGINRVTVRTVIRFPDLMIQDTREGTRGQFNSDSNLCAAPKLPVPEYSESRPVE